MNDLFYIYGGLISLLLAIVGYFLNKQVQVIEELTKAVSALTVTVALLQNNQNNAATTCAGMHQVINNRFSSHSEKLHEYGNDIQNLKLAVTILNKEAQE